MWGWEPAPDRGHASRGCPNAVHPSFTFRQLPVYLRLLTSLLPVDRPAPRPALMRQWPHLPPKGNPDVKLQRLGILAGIALTATVALAACGTDNNSSSPSSNSTTTAAGCATGTVNAQGSTAQANAIAQWIKSYQSKCSGATINYQGTGSGAGQQAFIAGTADFAGSDSPLAPADQTSANNRCKAGPAIHLPMVDRPDRGRLQPQRHYQPAVQAGNPCRNLRQQDHQVERPGDRGGQPRREATVDLDHCSASGRRVRHQRQLHQLPDQHSFHCLDVRPQ